MTRRILGVLLGLLLAGMPVIAVAAEAAPISDLTYIEQEDGTAIVTGLTAAANQGTLEIPSEVDGHAVTGIAAGAFRGTAISVVEVPLGVLSIGEAAFADCTALTSATFPSSLETLGSGIFQGSGLTSFTVPAGTTTIPANMFSGCSALQSVTIPTSVTAVAAEAFSGCSNLQIVYYTGTQDEYEEIQVASDGNTAFTSAAVHVASTSPVGFLYNIEGATLGENLTVEITGLTDPEQTGPVMIPEVLDGYPVTAIGPNAFERYRGITEMDIPASVTTISNNAFENCSSLTAVSIADGLTTIGDSAFQGCTVLQSIWLPDSVTDVGGFAFAACPALVSAVLPRTTDVTGEYLFAYSGLEHFHVPRAWNNIPKGTFQGCENLSVVTIPSTIFSVGEDAFAACTGLERVYLLGSEAEAGSIIIHSGNAPYQSAQKTITNLALSVEELPDSTAKYITGITATTHGETAATILPILHNDTSADAIIYAAGPDSAAVGSDEVVGTGMTARWTTSAGESDAAQFVVMGDVVGSGQLNIVQLVRLANALMGNLQLEGPYLAAGDWDANGRIDIVDLTREAELFVENQMQ